MSASRSPSRARPGLAATRGGNPGKAGPKGALALPAARNKKRGRDVDRNEQRNFTTLSKTERKRSRRDGPN